LKEIYKQIYPFFKGIHWDDDIIYKLYIHGNISCDIVEYFIQQYKGDIKKQFNDSEIYGYTKVLYDGNFDIMIILLKYGFNINKKDKKKYG